MCPPAVPVVPERVPAVLFVPVTLVTTETPVVCPETREALVRAFAVSDVPTETAVITSAPAPVWDTVPIATVVAALATLAAVTSENV